MNLCISLHLMTKYLLLCHAFTAKSATQNIRTRCFSVILKIRAAWLRDLIPNYTIWRYCFFKVINKLGLSSALFFCMPSSKQPLNALKWENKTHEYSRDGIGKWRSIAHEYIKVPIENKYSSFFTINFPYVDIIGAYVQSRNVNYSQICCEML